MVSKLLHLQGLRALAIIFVVLFHFFPKFFPNGYLGVDQFFLLSGYLMTMMLEQKEKLSIGIMTNFFYKRLKRIVPLYYLATLLILVLINLTPTITWTTNCDSAFGAILFTTNLIRPTGLEGYNERLGMGVDMFTHTWSLAVEMQFYFLFPLIFFVTQTFNKPYQSVIPMFLGATSLFFHAQTDQFLSFYCVFARIWEFMAGMLIYYESNKREKEGYSYEHLDVLLDETSIYEVKDQSLRRFVAYLVLTATVVLLSTKEAVNPLAGRVLIILMTALIVHVGEKCWLLENRAIVFIGEISYGWYLVHWPVVAILKMNKWTSHEHMLAGLGLTIIISAIIYFAYETQYRSWDWQKISLTVSGLLLLNGAAYMNISVQLPENNHLPSSQLLNLTRPYSANLTIYGYDFENPDGTLFYENMTNAERAKLNHAMSVGDSAHTRAYPCTKLPTKEERETRCLNEFPDSETNMTLLVMGNSYTGNAMTTIYRECGDVFAKVYSTWVAACTPLTRDRVISGRDCSIDGFYLDAAQQFKPDVLFILARWMDVNIIDRGTNPFNDRVWKEMVDRITEIEKHVSKKIYILDTFEWPLNAMEQRLSHYLTKGVPFNESDFFMPSHKEWYRVAKSRLARLVEICKKCRLFDYTNQFYTNGQLHYYDPKYFVSFFAYSLHPNPVGLARIAPLYHHICHNFERE